MENMMFCQSCGMPLNKDEDFGANADGGKNEEYCAYCFQNGAFIADMTMDQMIDFCADHAGEWGMEITREQAVAQMRAHFPQLKRWKA